MEAAIFKAVPNAASWVIGGLEVLVRRASQPMLGASSSAAFLMTSRVFTRGGTPRNPRWAWLAGRRAAPVSVREHRDGCMGAGAPTVLSDWFMHADACKPQPGCGWCRGAMRAQMRRLSGCADSKGGGARAACSARGDAEMNAGRRVTRRRGNQVDEGVAQGHEQAERQVRRSYSSPPEGGEFDPPTPILRWAARCACGLRPAPRALLRVGRCAPPTPPGCAPCASRRRHQLPAD